MWVAFANAKATHISSAKMLPVAYMPYLIKSFNDTWTINIVSFEQLGTACEKMVVITCEQRRSRSDCTFVQSDLGFHCSVTESLDTEEYTDEHKRPHSDDTDA